MSCITDRASTKNSTEVASAAAPRKPARREPDIEQLFTSLDAQQTLDLLDKYNITYVYVGPLERERYPAEGLNKFAFLMDVVFDQDGAIIYQRR